MSRDIRFRAWDKVRKVMFIIFDSTNQTEWYLPNLKDNFEVMQYTGLKDKNKKDIYEGDLVWTYEPEEGKLSEKIIYENGSFRVNCLSGDKIDYPIGSILSKYIEVIGNIFENPELLKEEAKC